MPGRIRDHPDLADFALALAFLSCSAASVFYVATLVGWPVAVLLNGLPALALARRRRRPAVVLAACLGLDLAVWLLAVPFNFSHLVTLGALYTVARYEPRRSALTGLGACAALVLIAPLRQPYTGAASTVLLLLILLVVYVLGTNVALRQGYLQALEERASRLERERDAAAEAATAIERTRIARELHDVVAHHVSVMVVQAEGAGWALDASPEQARTAMTTIAQTGRSTLVELRRLLGVLRDPEAGALLPQPTLKDLPALVDGFRAGGLSVQLELVDTVRLAQSLELAAFRIVQEGLTNVLKHAGPSAAARVSVQLTSPAGSPGLVVEIVDDGELPDLAPGPIGHGLIGIRERVALFDGHAVIGPRAGGGFGVRAVLPVGSS
jgi:signal transduction histidine kinase